MSAVLKPTYGLEEAAGFVRLHPITLASRARAGKIPGAAKPGKEWVFTEEGLRAYLNSISPCPYTGEAEFGGSKLKGTGVVWHTLRHTWASWFVMNGGTLQELMALGGWKSYSMVLRYAHLATEHLAVAAARVKPVSLRYNARRGGRNGTKSPTTGA